MVYSNCTHPELAGRLSLAMFANLRTCPFKKIKFMPTVKHKAKGYSFLLDRPVLYHQENKEIYLPFHSALTDIPASTSKVAFCRLRRDHEDAMTWRSTYETVRDTSVSVREVTDVYCFSSLIT